MKSHLMVLALAMALPIMAEGQSPSITAGARARVTSPGNAFDKHVTTIMEVRGDSIVIGEPGNARTLALNDVTALDLSTRRGTHFLRDAGIGLGIGIVSGAVIGAVTYKECVPQAFLECLMAPESRADAAGMGAVVAGGAGLVVGAVVGAFHRTDRWTAIDLPFRASVAPTPSGGLCLTLSRAF